MATAGGILRQALPALALTTVGALVAGALLGHFAHELGETAGMLVLVPALMGLRGNISGALGGRLGSAAHLGLLSIEDPFNGTARNNIFAAITLSAGTGVFAGALGWAASSAFGYEPAPLVVFLLVAGLTGLLASLVLSVVTLTIVLVAFHRGIDPDNVTYPILSTVGDIVTILILVVVLAVVS